MEIHEKEYKLEIFHLYLSRRIAMIRLHRNDSPLSGGMVISVK